MENPNARCVLSNLYLLMSSFLYQYEFHIIQVLGVYAECAVGEIAIGEVL